MEVMASGWNSSLSVRHIFQYTIKMMTTTARRGQTTPRAIHVLVFSEAEGEDDPFSTALDTKTEKVGVNLTQKTHRKSHPISPNYNNIYIYIL